MSTEDPDLNWYVTFDSQGWPVKIFLSDSPKGRHFKTENADLYAQDISSQDMVGWKTKNVTILSESIERWIMYRDTHYIVKCLGPGPKGSIFAYVTAGELRYYRVKRRWYDFWRP